VSRPQDIVVIKALCGSLRRDSYNRRLLQAAEELLPDGARLDVVEWRALPYYDEDLEREALPDSVVAFRQAIAEGDALLIASPEYNYSLPGGLKNALDWASRPPGRSVLAGKPAAVIGASRGLGGTIRAQSHLRLMAVGLDLMMLNKPEIYLTQAEERFSADGRLTDETARRLLAELLSRLIVWTRLLKGSEAPVAAAR
jgi:chromate reductase